MTFVIYLNLSKENLNERKEVLS